MCLLVHIRADGIPRRQAGVVTQQVRTAGGAPLEAHRRRKAETGSLFTLGRGCACALLSNDAELGEAYFRLDPDQAAAIEQTLVVIRDASEGRPFVVHAAWADGMAAFEVGQGRTVTFAELVDDIRRARIANDVAYQVS